MHSTNYFDTFIQIAEDCPESTGVVPPEKEPKTAARRAWEMLSGHDYEYTSDDVLYAVNGQHKGLSREAFYSAGQPCFRASPLTKRYGWGIHHDRDGKIALVARDSARYRSLSEDTSLKQLRAMRSAKKKAGE